VFDGLAALQAWTDARVEDRAHRLRCPATGTSVAEAWNTERGLLTPLPDADSDEVGRRFRFHVGP
jgi:hypothetical protein